MQASIEDKNKTKPLNVKRREKQNQFFVSCYTINDVVALLFVAVAVVVLVVNVVVVVLLLCCCCVVSPCKHLIKTKTKVCLTSFMNDPLTKCRLKVRSFLRLGKMKARISI